MTRDEGGYKVREKRRHRTLRSGFLFVARLLDGWLVRVLAMPGPLDLVLPNSHFLFLRIQSSLVQQLRLLFELVVSPY